MQNAIVFAAAVDPVGDAVDRLVALGERLLVDDLAAKLCWKRSVKAWPTSSPTSCSSTSQNISRPSRSASGSFGGKIVDQESFTQGDEQSTAWPNRINGETGEEVATLVGTDQPAFVDSLRTLGNDTTIMNSWAGDGTYWWSRTRRSRTTTS